LVIILRKIGFVLRKDNPLQLKEFIINLKSKLNEINSQQNEGNSRLKFMLESLVAIKNNDIRKLTDSFYSDDQINCEDIYELLIKRIKTLYSNNMKYNDVQLNVSLSDLLNSNKRGKWWIVGSAWSNEDNNKVEDESDNVESRKLFKQNKSNFSEKLLELAHKQHMNTDIRRTIFCIIMSAEDYTDAYVKLMKLALKKKQEREIVYIIVHCLLNEKAYNPYYSHLMQRFCDFDRRFKVFILIFF
jgi:nucleolar MIF4G domain-containing protein 1